MKLNLVADYDVGGKHIIDIFAILGGTNLARLPEMTAICVPVSGGSWAHVKAKTLEMCESRRKALEVACTWRRDYEAQGRLWDFKPIDASEIEKGEQESEVRA